MEKRSLFFKCQSEVNERQNFSVFVQQVVIK